MNQLNSIIIEGNVTRTPEFREPVKGFKVCTIPVAVNRFYKNANGNNMNEVSFFNIETYGKMAEMCNRNCTKGRGLRIVGRLKQNRWKNSEGQAVSRISIIAEHVEFKKRISSKEEEISDSEAAKAASQASYSRDDIMEEIDSSENFNVF